MTSMERSSQPSHNTGHANVVKVVMVGSLGVGKTCLVNTYKHTYESTIGAAFTLRKVQIGDQMVRLHIWDTGGQERYRSLVSLYYRNAQAAIVVYDVTDGRTLDAAIKWVDELKLYAPDDVIIFLAGNKLDLADERREIDTEVGRHFAQETHLMFTEVSAKTGDGVSEMYNTLASVILSKRGNLDQSQGQLYDNIRLIKRDQAKSSCSC